MRPSRLPTVLPTLNLSSMCELVRVSRLHRARTIGLYHETYNLPNTNIAAMPGCVHKKACRETNVTAQAQAIRLNCSTTYCAKKKSPAPPSYEVARAHNTRCRSTNKRCCNITRTRPIDAHAVTAIRTDKRKGTRRMSLLMYYDTYRKTRAQETRFAM